MKTTIVLVSFASCVLSGLAHSNGQRYSMNTHSLSSEGRYEDSTLIRLTVVYDNNPLVTGLRTAWGFACFVELGATRFLFDTGGDGDILLENMAKLGISPGDVDAVVISHIHHDHLGGLMDLLHENSALAVYVPKSFPPDVSRDIQMAGAKLIRADSCEQLSPQAFTLGIFKGSIPEQALVIRTDRGLALITGCAHPGIVNIVQGAQSVFPNEPVCLVIGGFHLSRLQSGDISDIVRALRGLGVQKVAPCHCSGETARMFFKRAYGESFIEMGVGGRIDIPSAAGGDNQRAR
jgi:7,8-dihydropterin-6-yl-methyl-4-(beta-D-ribofuranosyl)aminobenzene 5'-phosphate synthase